jgi:hypothetical protein
LQGKIPENHTFSEKCKEWLECLPQNFQDFTTAGLLAGGVTPLNFGSSNLADLEDESESDGNEDVSGRRRRRRRRKNHRPHSSGRRRRRRRRKNHRPRSKLPRRLQRKPKSSRRSTSGRRRRRRRRKNHRPRSKPGRRIGRKPKSSRRSSKGGRRRSSRRRRASALCINPLTQDPQMYECECMKQWNKRCETFNDTITACFKTHFCNGFNVCSKWKSQHCNRIKTPFTPQNVVARRTTIRQGKGSSRSWKWKARSLLHKRTQEELQIKDSVSSFDRTIAGKNAIC